MQQPAARRIPARAWRDLDGIDLAEEFGAAVRTVQGVPHFLRPGLRQAFRLALTELHRAYASSAEAESLDKSKMDKLRYVVMLSRWQEAAVNKKYDMKINECNLLKTQIIEKDEEIRSLELQREQHQNDSGRLVQENQSLRKQLARAKILFLPLSKAERFEDDIKKISHERD